MVVMEKNLLFTIQVNLVPLMKCGKDNAYLPELSSINFFPLAYHFLAVALDFISFSQCPSSKPHTVLQLLRCFGLARWKAKG